MLTIVGCHSGDSGIALHDLLVETLAGNGNTGNTVGPGTSAEFNQPDGVAIMAQGESDVAYITDMGNNDIKEIAPDGTVTLIAGTGTSGFTDGQAQTAQFNKPDGLATDSAGNIYVADSGNNAIRKIDAATDAVTTIAGGGPNNPGSTDGIGAAARFNNPTGIVVDPSGNIYVTDQGNNAVRKIAPDNTVTTIAGEAANPGYVDGPVESAKLNQPHGVAMDPSGNLYVTEWGNNTVRKIEMENNIPVEVSTVAGNGTAGDAIGKTSFSKLNQPHGIAVDSYGNVYVADENNNKIKKFDDTSKEITTYSGTGEASFEDGDADTAKFKNPRGLALGVKKKTDLYVCDYNNNRVRKIEKGN